jgi:hypothetical protein
MTMDALLHDVFAADAARAPAPHRVLARIAARRRAARRRAMAVIIAGVTFTIAVPYAALRGPDDAPTGRPAAPATWQLRWTPAWLPPGLVETARQVELTGFEVRRWDTDGRVGGAAGRGPTSDCSVTLTITGSPELGTRTDRVTIGGRAAVWTESGVRTALSIQLDARTWGSVAIYATDAALHRLQTSRADMAVRVAKSIRPDSTATLDAGVTLAPERTRFRTVAAGSLEGIAADRWTSTVTVSDDQGRLADVSRIHGWDDQQATAGLAHAPSIHVRVAGREGTYYTRSDPGRADAPFALTTTLPATSDRLVVTPNASGTGILSRHDLISIAAATFATPTSPDWLPR